MSKITCICRSCGQAIRAAKPKATAVARTAAEFLTPVSRRKIGRDRVHVTVECTFADAEVIRLTVARNPKDSDEIAVEVGRRLAVLFRARNWSRDHAVKRRCHWHDLGGRMVYSWSTEAIEWAAAELIECRAVAPESLYSIAAD